MKIIRRKTKPVKVGAIYIGGNHPVVIQSMAKTKTSDIENTVKQINIITAAGCEIVRVAVKDKDDARAIRKIKREIKIPLVADIHFDWRLAIEAVESGADKIRLNPGNIYRKPDVDRVVSALKSAKIPLRVGLNSGSVKSLNSKNMSLAERLVKGALDYIKVIEKNKFYDIVVSLKASGVMDTLEAYRKFSKASDYPLHLGVTATGSPYSGAIKSGIALGALLLEGIGDTVRISLTDKPQQEVYAAKVILQALGLRNFGPQIISCPTCGRCEVDLVGIVKELESRLKTMNYELSTRPLKVAVMGCVVNGPGEAREADIGVAFGKGEGLLFVKGKPVKKITSGKCAGALLEMLRKEKGNG